MATVYGAEPPMTRSVVEYGTSTVPDGGKSVSRRVETRSGKIFVAVAPSASLAVTSTANVPATVGVPPISASPGVTHDGVTPSPDRIHRPGGRPVSVQVNGAVPPL